MEEDRQPGQSLVRRAHPDDLDQLDRAHDVPVCRVDFLAAQLADAEGVNHELKLAPAPVDTAELFLYPGDKHLFAGSSLADFDERAAGQLKERSSPF